MKHNKGLKIFWLIEKEVPRKIDVDKVPEKYK